MLRELNVTMGYLAGPYTSRNLAEHEYNMGRFFLYTQYILPTPVICLPLLTGGVDHTSRLRNITHEEWLIQCKAFILLCDVVFVIPGSERSKGTQIEIEFAQDRGIRIENLPQLHGQSHGVMWRHLRELKPYHPLAAWAMNAMVHDGGDSYGNS